MIRRLFASGVLLINSWGAGCDIAPEFIHESVPNLTLVDCISKKPIEYSDRPVRCLLTDLSVKQALEKLEEMTAGQVKQNAGSVGGNVLIIKDWRGIDLGRRLYTSPYARGNFLRWENRTTLAERLENSFQEFFYRVAFKIDRPASCQELGFQVTEGIQFASCTLVATTQRDESWYFIKFSIKAVTDRSISENSSYAFGQYASPCPLTIEKLFLKSDLEVQK